MQTRASKYEFNITDRRRVTFYAAVFNEPTTIHEVDHQGRPVSFREVVLPGAFTDTLRTDTEVIANLDHDAGRTFARRSDGTLVIQEDPHGLWCSCWIPEGAFGDSILADIESGKLAGCSFRFGHVDTRHENGTVQLAAVSLHDVCLTESPCYKATEVSLRSDKQQQRSKFLFTKLRLMKIKQRATT